jgi:hypothetical protein
MYDGINIDFYQFIMKVNHLLFVYCFLELSFRHLANSLQFYLRFHCLQLRQTVIMSFAFRFSDCHAFVSLWYVTAKPIHETSYISSVICNVVTCDTFHRCHSMNKKKRVIIYK